MKYSIYAILWFTLIGTPYAYAAPDKYVFDKEHTIILFSVNHLGFSDKIGRFADYDGYFIFDQQNPEASSVDIIIRPTGIDTFSLVLDKLLQGKDWFNTAAYPEIHFKSSKIKITGDNTADIVGWLSMLGKDKPVTLHTKFNKSGVNPANKLYIAGFSADAVVSRSQFGMNNYVPFVGEDVKLRIEVEGVKQ